MSQNGFEVNRNQEPRRRRATQPVNQPDLPTASANYQQTYSQGYTQQGYQQAQQPYGTYMGQGTYRQQGEASSESRGAYTSYQQSVPPVHAENAWQPAPPVAPVQPQPQNVVVNVVNTNTASNVNNGAGGTDSHFDGKLSQQIGYLILGFLITLLTAGICYPWAFCMQYRWKTKHTVINGHRLAFDGTAFQLFGKWILWLLLCLITVGIYSFWVGIALEQWRVKHTHFAN